jgi:hypothetical protein
MEKGSGNALGIVLVLARVDDEFDELTAITRISQHATLQPETGYN